MFVTMVKMVNVTFSEYLEKKYIEWQHEHGRRKTIEEFAVYIGVSRPLLNMWMNGNRKPGKESLELLSAIFGNEVYDVLGYERPNPYLQKINQIFKNIPPDKQKTLAEDAVRYEALEQDDHTEKTHRRRKTASDQ